MPPGPRLPPEGPPANPPFPGVPLLPLPVPTGPVPIPEPLRLTPFPSPATCLCLPDGLSMCSNSPLFRLMQSAGRVRHLAQARRDLALRFTLSINGRAVTKTMISEIRRGRTDFDALPLFHQRGFSAGLFTGEIGTVFPYNIFIRGNRQRRTSSEQWTGGKVQGWESSGV